MKRPLDPVLRREVAAIRRLQKRERREGKRFVATVAESGKRLLRIKERVGHRHWLKFLKENFGWSIRTAENRIAVFRLLQTAKFASLANLPLELLYELGRRTVPDEAREAIVKRIEAGVSTTRADVRKAKALYGPRYTESKQSSKRLSIVPTRHDAATPPPKPYTAEDLQADHRRHLVGLITDVAKQLPADRSIEAARAVVVIAGAEGKRESFSVAVAMLDDFVGELRRALNERLIEVPASPTLRLIPGKGD